MARKPRLHVSGGLYHVIARGNDRQAVFREAVDYQEYLKRLHTGLLRHDIRCYAYCLMPNHVHLLLEPGSTPVSRLMQGIQGAFAQYLNRRYRRVGHRFQGRFLAILCEKDSYLLELVRYLHLNPVRAGLTRRPGNWPWSSHRAYLGSPEKGVPLGQELVLAQFHREPSHARKAFDRFVREGLAMGHQPEFYDVWEQRVLGNPAFAEATLASRRETPAPPPGVSIEAILRAVAEDFNIPMSNISAVGRARGPARARAVAAYLARELIHVPLTAVATAVRRDPATLSHAVRRLDETLSRAPQVRRRVERLAQRLRGKSQKGKRTA